jgi:hypothetical protein
MSLPTGQKHDVQLFLGLQCSCRCHNRGNSPVPLLGTRMLSPFLRVWESHAASTHICHESSNWYPVSLTVLHRDIMHIWLAGHISSGHSKHHVSSWWGGAVDMALSAYTCLRARHTWPDRWATRLMLITFVPWRDQCPPRVMFLGPTGTFGCRSGVRGHAG